MKKRAISFVMVIILAICILPLHAAAGTLSNFQKTKTYNAGQFTDISDQWFALSVRDSFEYGLFDGTSPSTFSPEKNLTIAEAIKLAACLNSTYNTGSASFPKDASPWYQPFVDYALSNGIIKSPYPNYTVNATRSDMALIFANALPDEAMTALNTISDNAIPDVAVGYTYGAAVYKLYRAGILTGSGDSHAFKPNDNITRAEVAAIVARMASSSNRVSFTISSKELSATEIAAKCSPAVFYMELYDSTGTAFASGSGFFISSSGLAVTNFHVINGASSAKILTTDGKVYNVSGVYDYREAYDLALIQIDGANFPYLDLGDSSSVVTGATVYAIGSPKGLDNTFSQGIVSNASRTFSDSVVKYIQIDAAISHGSSGGALINTKGQVIGVTAAGRDDAQNINFAVPANLVKELSRTAHVPLSAITVQSTSLTVTAAPSTVSVVQGAQTTIIVTVSSQDFDSIAFAREDKTMISCSWGEWSGNTIPLTINGLIVGTTTLDIGLLDDTNEQVLAETTVNVTVTAGSSTTTTSFYPSYYPVPDFGALNNVSLYDTMMAETYKFYYYRVSDLNDAGQALLNYNEALAANGFVYMGILSGYNLIWYVHDTYSWVVDVGYSTRNGVDCVCVAIAS